MISSLLSLGGYIGQKCGQLMPVVAVVYVHILPVPALQHSALIDGSLYLAFQSGQLVAVDRAPSSRLHKPGSVLGATVSAYSSTVEQTDASPFTTASGTRVRPGVAAANFLPLGSKVRIGPYIYTIEDRMNSRYNGSYRVDIWMPSTDKAVEFGVQKATLEIVSVPR